MPLQYQIYKGMGATPKWGALQFSLKEPEFTGDLKTSKEGVVFLNITSTKEKNVYDWENKIVLALSATELGQILHVMTQPGKDGAANEVKIMHDPGAGSDTKGQVVKGLYVSAPKGPMTGLMFTATQQKDDVQLKHVVPVAAGELVVLKNLFETAIPIMLGWAQ